MKKLLFLALLSFSISSIYGQTEFEEPIKEGKQAISGMNFILGFPVGAFKEKQPEIGIGFSGNVLVEVRKPLSVGLDVSWQQYDSEFDFFLETNQNTFESFTTKEEANNNILGINAVFRVEPEVNFFLKPYLEGTFGVNRFHTKTVFSDADSDEQLNTISEHSDWALTYGAAAGVLVNVWQGLLFLDLKCAYRIGNTAQYYTRIEDANFAVPLDNFELRQSPTNMVIPQIGLTFLLNTLEEEEYFEEEY